VWIRSALDNALVRLSAAVAIAGRVTGINLDQRAVVLENLRPLPLE
jgi:hypothetical protein